MLSSLSFSLSNQKYRFAFERGFPTFFSLGAKWCITVGSLSGQNRVLDSSKCPGALRWKKKWWNDRKSLGTLLQNTNANSLRSLHLINKYLDKHYPLHTYASNVKGIGQRIPESARDSLSIRKISENDKICSFSCLSGSSMNKSDMNFLYLKFELNFWNTVLCGGCHALNLGINPLYKRQWLMGNRLPKVVHYRRNESRLPVSSKPVQAKKKSPLVILPRGYFSPLPNHSIKDASLPFSKLK